MCPQASFTNTTTSPGLTPLPPPWISCPYLPPTAPTRATQTPGGNPSASEPTAVIEISQSCARGSIPMETASKTPAHISLPPQPHLLTNPGAPPCGLALLGNYENKLSLHWSERSLFSSVGLAYVCAKSLPLCPTLCNPMGYTAG